MRLRFAFCAALALVAAPAWSGPSDFIRNPLHAAQPKAAPEEAVVLVEIPAGSFTKYETGEDGLIFVDRFLSMPVAYPANYGSMPSTLAGDHDPLDALVLTREPLHPGVLIGFRPIGVLRMRDKGQQDEKIIGVPTDRIDPSYAGIRDLADLPQAERARLEAFFRVYKDLPQGRNTVELAGWGDAAEARAVIAAAMQRAAAQGK
ncbi:inorganic diphosphatase [Pseudoxanthomonas composti]|uniref:Inorganic pyrophosphatase n=1 Tax=Pseudoxanthomonas composti TaxID=2137479 RepID=A0A4Q1K0B7_9GAMM|nr:inorganic diphosphatase [Pseudoxanthomonas composti]RXR08461.1 inorganic diphosphatase [Pseudoxanthomonas composti]